MTERQARAELERLEKQGTYAVAVPNSQGVWSVFVGGRLYSVEAQADAAAS